MGGAGKRRKGEHSHVSSGKCRMMMSNPGSRDILTGCGLTAIEAVDSSSSSWEVVHELKIARVDSVTAKSRDF